MSAFRNNLIEQVKFLNRPPSVVFVANTFVHNLGGNNVEPLQPGSSVDGLSLQGFDNSNPYFATAGLNMPVDGVDVTVDRFLIDVTGTASLGMVGNLFDIVGGGGANAGIVNVAPLTLTYGTLAGGPFTAGEIVTVTSGPGLGTTFQIITDNGANSMTIQSVHVVSSGIVNGENLLGNSSGATAQTTEAVTLPSQFKMEQFISPTSCEFSVARNY